MKGLKILLRFITTALILSILVIAGEHAKAYYLQDFLSLMIVGWLLGKIFLSVGPYYISFNLDCIAMGVLIGWISIITYPEYRIKNTELQIEHIQNLKLNEEYLEHHVAKAGWKDMYIDSERDKLKEIGFLTRKMSDLRATNNYTLQIVLALLSILVIFKGGYTILKSS